MKYKLSWWEFKGGHWEQYSKEIEGIPRGDLLEVAKLIYESRSPEYLDDIVCRRKG